MNENANKSRKANHRTATTLVYGLVACLIMMWGVINLVHNFLGWQKGTWQESGSLGVTIAFVIITGLGPALFGILMLLRGPKSK